MSKPLPVQVEDATIFPQVHLLHARNREGAPDEVGSQLARALDHIGQGLCIFDGKGRITAHNRLLPELLNLPERSLVGRMLLELNRMAASAAE